MISLQNAAGQICAWEFLFEGTPLLVVRETERSTREQTSHPFARQSPIPRRVHVPRVLLEGIGPLKMSCLSLSLEATNKGVYVEKPSLYVCRGSGTLLKYW